MAARSQIRKYPVKGSSLFRFPAEIGTARRKRSAALTWRAPVEQRKQEQHALFCASVSCVANLASESDPPHAPVIRQRLWLAQARRQLRTRGGSGLGLRKNKTTQLGRPPGKQRGNAAGQGALASAQQSWRDSAAINPHPGRAPGCRPLGNCSRAERPRYEARQSKTAKRGN